MSILVTTPEQICKSQLNSSKSKYLYSFPKSNRFNAYIKPLCDNIYNIPDKFSKRKAGFGYGDKTDFTKDRHNNPSPNNYLIKNIFDKGVEKKLGYIFGESRSKMNQTGIVKKYLEGFPG